MKLQLFDGGQNSRKAPHFLAANQGVKYINIDNSTGVLEPVNKAIQTNLTKSAFAYYWDKEDVWIDKGARTDFAELNDTLYYTVNGLAYKYKNGVEKKLGIAPPTTAPTVAITNHVTKMTSITAVNTSVGNLPNDPLYYVLVNVNEAGSYSVGSLIRVALSLTSNASVSISDYVPAEWENISTVSNTEVGTRGVSFSAWHGVINDRMKLFRWYAGKFHLVAEREFYTPVIEDTVFDISANAVLDNTAFNPLLGTYSYVYTFYDNNTGAESAPSPVSVERTLASGKVQISNLAISSNTAVTHKIIYRVGGDVTEFTELARITNATTSYLDETKDTDLDNNLLTSDNYDAPALGLKYLTEAYAMLFGAIGTKLFFTPIGLPDAWPGDYFVEIGKTITGIGTTVNGLLVCTKNTTYILTGSGPLSLVKSLLSSDQGCINHYSMASTQGSLLWVSNDGVCSSNGGVPEVLTKTTLGKIKLVPTYAVVHDEVYYCLNSDKSILAIDFRFSPIVKWLMPDLESLVIANDTLYGHKDGQLWEFFASTDKEQFEYLSPRLTETTAAMLKTYKKVYIYSKGVIKLKVYVDDVLVSTSNFTTEDTHVVQVPQDLQRGCFIQFEVSGTGQVYEIWYIAGESKNGQ